MQRPKFAWTQEQVDGAIRGLSAFAKHVEPKQPIDDVKEDPTDNRIIECAAASGSEYLVSGDKHLLKVGQYKGVKIVSPADFIEVIAGQSRAR